MAWRHGTRCHEARAYVAKRVVHVDTSGSVRLGVEQRSDKLVVVTFKRVLQELPPHTRFLVHTSIARHFQPHPPV